jgi:drug/metabolite transporter (DMT)-like permease
MLWGGTFLIVQNALSASGAFFFVGLRFSAAAAMLALVSHKQLGGFTLLEVKAGVIVGISMVLGYTLQTIGLETILSSKSAFLTALYVPIVPLLQWVLLRRAPRLAAWAGIGLAFLGLVLLTGPEGTSFDFSKGEFVTVPPFSWLLLLSVLGLGLMSAVIQLAMNWAQRTVSPTRATIIYAGEPVWAGLFGRVVGEVLGPRAITGAALIVLAVIVSELKLRQPDRELPAGAPDAERS